MGIDLAPVLAQSEDMAMHLYPEMAAAMQADDVDRYVALLDEDFEYVRHKSGDVLDRAQTEELLRQVWRPGNRSIESLRCLYENDDILVAHFRLSFRSGSRESAIVVHTKKHGKVVRIESGVSDLT